MAEKRTTMWPAITGVIAVLLLLIALPEEYKQWAPSFLRTPSFHFGLDLAGGTQLDFRISERELEEQKQQIQSEIEEAERSHDSDRVAVLQLQLSTIEQQQRTVVEAIRTVLERRINSMGVSETSITPSYIGDEKHLLVQCPGVVDVQECISTVGKTIKLEFKEEFLEATDEFRKEVRERADIAYARITESEQTLEVVGQDLSDELGVFYEADATFFREELPDVLAPMWSKNKVDKIIFKQGTIRAPRPQEDGSMAEEDVPGIFIAQQINPVTQTGRTINEAAVAFDLLQQQESNLEKRSHTNATLNTDVPNRVISSLRDMQQGDLMSTGELPSGEARVLFLRQFQAGSESMTASHILFAYSGAVSAGTDVTRTKEDALQLSKDVKKQLDDGSDFAALARELSNGPSGEQGGTLGDFGRGDMVPAFEQAAFALPEGAVSEPTETPFGYHLIRSDRASTNTIDTANYEELIVTGSGAAERAEEIVARLGRGDVKRMDDNVTVQFLFFSMLPTGWRDTALDGKHFRSATVTLDPTSNIPVVQINFDDEGGQMFQELTARNINKRIAIFVGGQLISAPTVQGEISGGSAVITGSRNIQEARELATDLNTGAIPAPIYLSGQRTVEATLGAEALRTAMEAALLGAIILMIYMIVVYRLLGLVADMTLSIYALLFFTFLKMPLFLVSSQHIVLSLAGMAGIILSIGMAVDANVLIFERVKEELRKGKLLKTAVRTGFERAWPSIRDGNISTLITCTILFLVGTSIVRGFAVTLSTGVLLSMFTAIVITRWILNYLAKSPLAEKTWLFGVRSANVNK